jgi:LacI family transcriptional regulator
MAGEVMMRNSKRVTIKQVAREAGVSTQTVSRVINDRPDVAPETRQRVQQVISDLSYRPSALARSLIHQRSFTLGVVTAGLKYIGPNRTLNGITEEAEELGYSLLLKELPRFDAKDIQPILDALLARQVDGIIWAVPEVGGNMRWLQVSQLSIPVPMIFLTIEARTDFSIVSVDNYLGGRIATSHLLEQGYRRIGHITGPIDWWEVQQRKSGWQDALTDAGLNSSEEHWVEGNWSSASGERAFCELIENYPEMDAVFVANDQMALGVLLCAYRRGLEVPQDLGIVGFDSIPEGAFFWPPLTTVHQDLNKLGCTAVQELVENIESDWNGNRNVDSKNILIQPQIVIRESSTGPRTY